MFEIDRSISLGLSVEVSIEGVASFDGILAFPETSLSRAFEGGSINLDRRGGLRILPSAFC